MIDIIGAILVIILVTILLTDDPVDVKVDPSCPTQQRTK
jgi:hypothetical protein